MPTIMPKNELVRRALTYLDEQRREHPGKPLSELLDETGMRFNLGPGHAEDLARLYRGREKPEND